MEGKQKNQLYTDTVDRIPPEIWEMILLKNYSPEADHRNIAGMRLLSHAIRTAIDNCPNIKFPVALDEEKVDLKYLGHLRVDRLTVINLHRSLADELGFPFRNPRDLKELILSGPKCISPENLHFILDIATNLKAISGDATLFSVMSMERDHQPLFHRLWNNLTKLDLTFWDINLNSILEPFLGHLFLPNLQSCVIRINTSLGHWQLGNTIRTIPGYPHIEFGTLSGMLLAFVERNVNLRSFDVQLDFGVLLPYVELVWDNLNVRCSPGGALLLQFWDQLITHGRRHDGSLRKICIKNVHQLSPSFPLTSITFSQIWMILGQVDTSNLTCVKLFSIPRMALIDAGLFHPMWNLKRLELTALVPNSSSIGIRNLAFLPPSIEHLKLKGLKCGTWDLARMSDNLRNIMTVELRNVGPSPWQRNLMGFLGPLGVSQYVVLRLATRRSIRSFRIYPIIVPNGVREIEGRGVRIPIQIGWGNFGEINFNSAERRIDDE